MRLALALLCLLLAAPLAAQEPDSLAAVLSRDSPGALLRVETRAGERVEAPLAAVDPGTLALGEAEGVRTLELAEVRVLWVRERQTRRGAVVGGATAGGVSAVVFGFLGFVLAGIGADPHEALAFAVGGTLLGTAGGAVAGGIVGSASPRWRRVYRADHQAAPAPPVAPPPAAAPPPPAPPAPAPPAARPRLGSAELALGYGRSGLDGGTGGGPGTRVALLSEWDLQRRPGGSRRFVALGLETASQDVGTTGIRRGLDYGCLPDCSSGIDTVEVRRSYRVRSLGAVARLVAVHRQAQPYAVLGAGMLVRQQAERKASEPEPGASYGSVNPFRRLGEGGHVSTGISLGAGVQRRLPGSRYAAGVEARWHTNLLRQEEPGLYPGEGYSFWTVGATLNRRW